MSRSKSEWFTIMMNDFGRQGAYVPLNEAVLDAALSDAMDVWNKYIPIYDNRSLKIPNGLLILDLSAEPEVHGVGDYRYTDSTVDINRTLSPFYPIQIMSMSLAGPRLAFEVNHTIERWAQLLGGKEDQIWDPERKRLFIWNPRGMSNISFVVYKTSSLANIEPHRYSLFRSLFRSKVRDQILQIFNRLGPVPGPDGGKIENDMDYQKELRDKEMEEVIQILERMPEAMTAPRWD